MKLELQRALCNSEATQLFSWWGCFYWFMQKTHVLNILQSYTRPNEELRLKNPTILIKNKHLPSLFAVVSSTQL